MILTCQFTLSVCRRQLLTLLLLTSLLKCGYCQAKTYTFGQIPPQTIWYDVSPSAPATALDFTIKASKSGATLTISVSPKHVGAVSFDSRTGHFRYEPDAGDTTDFTVTFVQHSPAGLNVPQVVTISPQRRVAQNEYSLVAESGQIPDSADADYISISDEIDPQPQDFNGADRQTKTISISGKTVVLSSARKDLYDRVNSSEGKNQDVKTLNIYAETLIIRSPVNLPQANVNIWAREVDFQDQDNPAGTARIVTTPAERLKAVQGTAIAKSGYAAGSITLHVGHLDMGDPMAVCFVLQGGKGQAAGEGKAGPPGASMKRIWNGDARINLPGHEDMVYWEEWQDGRIAQVGEQKWPGNGGPATPAGMPGKGGDGGRLISSVAIDRKAVNKLGGRPGNMGQDQKGGDPGQPAKAYWMRRDWDWHERPPHGPGVSHPRTSALLEGTHHRPATHADFQPSDADFQLSEWVNPKNSYISPGSHEAQPGADAPALGPAPAGEGGEIIPLADNQWLHPAFMEAVLAHAKDTYLNGQLHAVTAVLDDYMPLLAGYRADPDNQDRMSQVATEMASLKHRLSANLDYFGNPAGWVPMLSYETNLRAYHIEENYAIRILYLSYWLDRRQKDKQQQVSALNETISQLNKDTAKATSDYNQAQAALPGLQRQVAVLTRDSDDLQKLIADKKRELEQRAKDNIKEKYKAPFWKQATRFLATAAKVIPVYQPVLGSIGAGLDILADIDTTSPLTTITQASDLGSSFSDSDLSASAADFNKIMSGLDRRNAANVPDYLKKLVATGKKFGGAVQKIAAAQQGTQAPASEVEAELQRLKASDPTFTDLVKKTTDLLAERRTFADRLDQTVEATGNLSNRVTTNIAAIDSMNTALRRQTTELDLGTVSRIKAIEQQSKERLLVYQYYLAKAYEYRLLKPFPVDYKLTALVDKIIKLVDTSTSQPALNDDNFGTLSVLFEAPIRNAIFQGLKGLETRHPDSSNNSYMIDLNPAELKKLNSDREVVFDLADKILPLAQEENRRIGKMSFQEGDVEAEVVGGGPEQAANVTIVASVEGRSLIRSGSRIYTFTHDTDGTYTPFTWGANIVAVKNKNNRIKVTDDRISDSSISLLKSFLTDPNSTTNSQPPGDVSLFVQPGADTQIRITRVVTTPGASVKLTKLRLAMTVEFFRADHGTQILHVRQGGDYSPLISINATDLGGRKDGRGAFTRIYDQQDMVLLTSPPVYGSLPGSGLHFQGWLLEDGTIKRGMSLPLNMRSSHYVTVLFGR